MSRPAVVLASGSPRRHDLLRRLGIEPVVRPPDVDETARSGETATALVQRLARSKAAAVEAPDGHLVVAADTVVALDGSVLGKPVDSAHARSLLEALSGRTHEVVTGVAVRFDDRVAVDVETTQVRFRRLTPAEVTWYVDTGEALDKAGGYALQGAGAALVESVEGSDTNVIGLPLGLLVVLARRVGVELLAGQ